MKKFFFNTGVKPGIPLNEIHRKNSIAVPLCTGQVWLNGTKQIPFECEDVPDNAVFKFASDCPNADEGFIVREIHNSSLISKYAHFII
jgi:hypothetical protein